MEVYDLIGELCSHPPDLPVWGTDGRGIAKIYRDYKIDRDGKREEWVSILFYGEEMPEIGSETWAIEPEWEKPFKAARDFAQELNRLGLTADVTREVRDGPFVVRVESGIPRHVISTGPDIKIIYTEPTEYRMDNDEIAS